MLLVKVLIVVLLLAVIISLFSGLFFLVKDDGSKRRTVNALTWRIGIWVVLLAFIVTAMKLGWIEPSNSVNPKNFNKEQQQRMNEN